MKRGPKDPLGAKSLDGRLSWSRRVLILVTLASIILLIAGMVNATRRLGTQSEAVSKSGRLMGVFSNLQRDSLFLYGESRHSHGLDIDALTERRGLLTVQWRAVKASASAKQRKELDVALVDNAFKRFDASMVPVVAGSRKEKDRLEVREAAKQLQRVVKQTFDLSERATYDSIDTEIKAREAVDRSLIGISALIVFLTVMVGRLLVVDVRRTRQAAGLNIAVERLQRERAETELERSSAKFESIVSHSSDMLLVLDPEGRMTYCSPAAARVTGTQADAIVGRMLSDLLHPDDADATASMIERLAHGAVEERPLGFRLLHRSGMWLYCEATGSNFHGQDGNREVTVSIRDVTERRLLEAQLNHRALHDRLTDLPNRELFHDRVSRSISNSRDGGETPAVLFLDIDDFKGVNDTLGHSAGDDLLKLTAGRLLASLGPFDSAARLGGDEFAVLLESATSDEAFLVAEKIVAAFASPFDVSGRQLHISTSIGIATGDASSSLEQLMSNADLAMYRAKELGKNRVELFDPSLYEDVIRRIDLESQLRNQLDLDQFYLDYQPIHELSSGSPIGCEALIRWRHPEHGLIPPLDFIPLAEQSSAIHEIGSFVLKQACSDLGRWRRNGLVGNDFFVSVNVSPKQLQSSTFPRIVEAVLRENELPQSTLMLEITEGVLMDEKAEELLHHQSIIGTRLAIDDFGTGYSSFSYLQRLDVDVIKVDKLFVEGCRDKQGIAVIGAICALSSALGCQTIGEGLEIPSDIEAYTELGVSLGQGYGLARPMSREAFEGFVRPFSVDRTEASNAGTEDSKVLERSR